MSSSPILGIPYPDPPDIADGPTLAKTLANAIDLYGAKIFASTANRDARISTPIPGMVAYTAAEATLWVCGTDQTWYSIPFTDTGWLNATPVAPSTGFTVTFRTDIGAPAFRQVGKTVYARGGFNISYSGVYTTASPAYTPFMTVPIGIPMPTPGTAFYTIPYTADAGTVVQTAPHAAVISFNDRNSIIDPHGATTNPTTRYVSLNGVSWLVG
jgi:hypothetical protein